MTNQPDDLVEELLALYQNMQFGHIPAFKIMESVARAAATIKELKAEVERLRALIGDHDLIDAGAYATMTARAAKAEEALRVIATNKTKLGITWAQEYAREVLGEEKA